MWVILHHSFIHLFVQSCAHSTFIEQILSTRNGLRIGGWGKLSHTTPVAGRQWAKRQEGTVRIREM